MAICKDCGQDIVVGDWPFCPHGETSGWSVHGDEIDYVDHNLGKEPIRIRSKAERRRLMAERGLQEAVRHVPHPAGASKTHTVDWSARPDDYTMRNRRLLLERSFLQPAEETEGSLMVPDIHSMDQDEAALYTRKK